MRGMNLSFQGQSCGSTSRLLVHEEIHEAFVAKVAERLEGMRVGLPTSDDTQIGTLVTRLDGFSDGMGNPGQLAATWQVRLDAITDFPRAAIQNIRVYERCFYLSQ